MRTFFKNNGLSIAFILLFLFSFIGQVYTGYGEHNKELVDEGAAAITIFDYLHSGHFIESTFENWESEFLQMLLFVVLTISLRQKGSSESKGFDGKEEVDREPSARRHNVPWPVKQGGIVLKLYQHSLSIALFILFALSFWLHLYGSLKDENEQLFFKHLPPKGLTEQLFSSRFWFESFQNWQSEFLSVFALVILSIYLRQKGSPQSKPVDAPHYKTGEK